jgi:hypothetical protein
MYGYVLIGTIVLSPLLYIECFSQKLYPAEPTLLDKPLNNRPVGPRPCEQFAHSVFSQGMNGCNSQELSLNIAGTTKPIPLIVRKNLDAGNIVTEDDMRKGNSFMPGRLHPFLSRGSRGSKDVGSG